MPLPKFALQKTYDLSGTRAARKALKYCCAQETTHPPSSSGVTVLLRMSDTQWHMSSNAPNMFTGKSQHIHTV
eukprot:8085389-Pyramimonas_sp.AAC.1